MKLVIYNDIHCGNPREVMGIDQLLWSLSIDKKKSETIYLLGDVIDLKNCPKRQVDVYHGMARELAKTCNYLFGNHEAMGSVGVRFIKYQNIILSHGDLEAWGEERALKFRNSPHGAGPLKRMMVAAIDEARLLIDAKLSQEHIDRACKLMRDNGCDTYICGHKHPKQRIVHEVNGMKIIVLQKGRNEVNL